MNFHWKQKQQEAFNTVKKTLLIICIFNEDNELQYHLITNISRTDAEKILFQL